MLGKKSLKVKILVATIVSVAMVCFALIGVSYHFSGRLAQNLSNHVLEMKLRGDINSANRYVEQYFGGLTLVGGQLVDSRSQAINERFEMVDAIQSELGVVATIFVRDGNDFTRVTTNIVVADGKRAVGTKLGTASAAYPPVSQGNLYIGDANILGKPYLTAYDPIVGSSGETIGILFIGIPRSDINGIIAAQMGTFIFFATLAGVLAAVVVASLVIWLAVKFLIKPIADVTTSIKAVAIGDISVSVAHESSDEIGDMAAACRTMILSNRDFAEKLSAIADGDWTTSVMERSGVDQLGLALKKMLAQVGDALTQVRTAVEEVSSGSEQISDASQSLSQGATESAASLEEITSSATEIGQQARSNAETAAQANSLSSAAKGAADRGASSMNSLNGSMAAITESSAQIAKIIKTIDDIAFQTNILALNAAVEAARAGRHGKGFAVVAEEVRNLAARSAKAARETAELIEGAQNRVSDGNKVAEETAAALAEIVGNVVKVGDLVGEMAAASNEQAQGIAQISQGLGQIDQVTQQNTATAEETAAAAEQLSGQAAELRQLVAQFKLKGGVGARARGAAGSDRPTRPAANPTPVRKPLPSPAVAKPAPLKADAAWGNPAKSAPAPRAKPANEEIISLEDGDFGRY